MRFGFPLAWLVAGYVALFWATAWALPHSTVIEAYDAVMVAVGIGVGIMFFRPALRSLMATRPSGTDFLIVGIFLNWPAQALQMLWRLGWRVAGFPDWMINHPWLGFVLSVAVLGGLLHMAARATEGQIPRHAWAAMAASIAAGGLFFAVSVSLGALGRPWAAPYSDWPPPLPSIAPYPPAQVP